MKQLVLIAISVLLMISMYSQNQDWEVYYGFSNQTDYPGDVIEQYDKGYYVGGLAGLQGWRIKTDINGSALYDNLFFHELCIVDIWAIAQDPSGNIYVGGLLQCEGINVFPYVAKFDSCGGKIWCKHFPNPESTGGGAVTDLIINNYNHLIVLMDYGCGSGNDQIYLAGLDENGNELWKKPYATKKDYPLIVNPIGWDLMELNGGYYIAGECYWPYPGNPNHVYLRPLFIGIDSYFKEKWMLPFYALDAVLGWAETMVPLNDSVIMGVGLRKWDGGEDRSLLMFVSTDGLELGYSQILNEQIGPDIRDNHTYDIARVNDTLFLAAANFGVETSVNPTGELIIDTAGSLYNFHSRPNTKPKTKMVKTFDDKYVIATSIREGNSNNWDIYLYKIDENLESVPFDTTQHVYDSLCPHTIQSGIIDLTDCLIVTDIGELPGPAEYYESLRWIPIKAYPNPVREGKVTFEFENTKHHQNMELRCYNNFGREIHRQKIYKGQQDTDVNVSAWGGGVYIAVIYSNGGAVGKVKFVVEGGRR